LAFNIPTFLHEQSTPILHWRCSFVSNQAIHCFLSLLDDQTFSPLILSDGGCDLIIHSTELGSALQKVVVDSANFSSDVAGTSLCIHLDPDSCCSGWDPTTIGFSLGRCCEPTSLTEGGGFHGPFWVPWHSHLLLAQQEQVLLDLLSEYGLSQD
jgi:hypothetical protein